LRHDGVGRSYLIDDVRTVSSIAVCSIDNSGALCVQKVQTKRERESEKVKVLIHREHL